MTKRRLKSKIIRLKRERTELLKAINDFGCAMLEGEKLLKCCLISSERKEEIVHLATHLEP